MEYSKFWPVDHKKGTSAIKSPQLLILSIQRALLPQTAGAHERRQFLTLHHSHQGQNRNVSVKIGKYSLLLIEHLLQVRHYEKYFTYFKYLSLSICIIYRCMKDNFW